VTGPIRLGILAWPQYTDWPALLEVGRRVDELGYDALWTWDHPYPIRGDERGPSFEGYLTLAGWAGVTKGATLGHMVTANPLRNPAMLVKIVTTLDHMSDGRAVLGIGAGWNVAEFEAFGVDIGRSMGERLDWLDEAVALARAMLDGEEPAATGGHYRNRQVRNEPRPIQPRLPILIGGKGKRKTLRTVARYADMWATFGDLDVVSEAADTLRRWCDEVRRHPSEIRWVFSAEASVLRDNEAEARRVAAEIGRHNGGWEGPGQAWTPEHLAEKLAPYVEMGFREIYLDMPAPYDDETLTRFIGEVGPLLEGDRAARQAQPGGNSPA
jgi:alkanesulfonate monooxygenase SsuD/methylene tetrahydromethanopterin reductase-like flavin-dependent oxidoreductase (luciferase family)